jgi:ELWxxDGT repeat protein
MRLARRTCVGARPVRAMRAALVEAVEPRVLLSAALVKDVNPFTEGSFPRQFTGVGDTVYFSAYTAGSGRELWRTDGTTGGTRLVADVNTAPDPFRPPRGASSNPATLRAVNGRVVFMANDNVHGREMWASDGTREGTFLLADINPGVGDGVPEDYNSVYDREPTLSNGVLYFVAKSGTGETGLWRTDGTPAGTRSIQVAAPGAFSSPMNLVDLNGTLYFSAASTKYGQELWKTDGTPGGTMMVKDVAPGDWASMTPNSPRPVGMGGLLYFFADDALGTSGLWKTDGTDTGTAFVSGLAPNFNPAALAATDSRVFISDYSTDRSVWGSDGTSAGTHRLKHFVSAGGFVPVGDTMYFMGDAGNDGDASGFELWKSDGTPAGTAVVTDLNPGPARSMQGDLVKIGPELFFNATDGNSGVEVWKSDGTAAGTALVKDIVPGPLPNYDFGQGPDPVPRDLAAVNGRLYFSASAQSGFETPQGDPEPWVSDGTAAGTVQIRNVNTQPVARAAPSAVVRADGRLWFTADDGNHGIELWNTDGTDAGTKLVQDLYAGPGDGVRKFVGTLNDSLYFYGSFRDLPFDGALYRTIADPNDPAFRLLRADVVDFGDAHATFGGNLYFTARAGSLVGSGSGTTLWRTDGTEDGTVAIKELVPGSTTVKVSAFAQAGGKLMFVARDGGNDQLWKTDGTAAGTVMLKQFPVRTDGSSPPGELVALGNRVYFTALSFASGDVLWASDGTETGTVEVKWLPTFGDPAPRFLRRMGDALYFLTSGGTGRRTLWRSDGTTFGTTQLTPQAAPGWDRLLVTGDSIYLASFATGQLWKSDGSAAGTALVRQVADAGGDGTIEFFEGAADDSGPSRTVVYFRSRVAGCGSELWRSDGTAVGTFMVQDVNEGAASSSPSDVRVIGHDVYFTADDGEHSRELWRYVPDAPPPAAIAGRHLFYNRSAFDGRDPAANAADDRAVAADKEPLLPGAGAPTGANVSGYARGINGVMVDVFHFCGTPSADDFVFETSYAAPGGAAAWRPAPAPQAIAIRPGAGEGGSDRVTLVWRDGDIRNTWLRVTVKPTLATGLAAPDVFCFGNLVGKVSNGAVAGGAPMVNALDLLAVRRRLFSAASINDPFDLDRDGRVTALDLAIVRTNYLRALAPPPNLLPT